MVSTATRSVFVQVPFLRRRWHTYSDTRPPFRLLVSTTNPPPHTPHVANPANRFFTSPRGGRPDNRPLSNRRARPSVSARRDRTRSHRSSDTIRIPSTGTRTQSSFGRRRWVHLSPIVALPRSVPHDDTAVQVAAQDGPNCGGRPADDGRQAVFAPERLGMRSPFVRQPLRNRLQPQPGDVELEDTHDNRRLRVVDFTLDMRAERAAVLVRPVKLVHVEITEHPAADHIPLAHFAR